MGLQQPKLVASYINQEREQRTRSKVQELNKLLLAKQIAKKEGNEEELLRIRKMIREITGTEVKR